MDMKIFKDIPGFEGYYQISNRGIAKSIERTTIRSDGLKQTFKGKILKPSVNEFGYMFVCLSKNGKIKMMRVHRLVASAFIPNPENKPEVNHKNGVKSDNELSNLEWNTRIENVRHFCKTGLKKAFKGEENYNSKLTESDVMFIRNNYTHRHPKFNTVAFSKKFGVHNTVISSIVTFKTWKHVKCSIKIKLLQLSLFD
jgi:hypothetical protein